MHQKLRLVFWPFRSRSKQCVVLTVLIYMYCASSSLLFSLHSTTTTIVVSLFYTSFIKVSTTACVLRAVNYYSKPDCWASAINDVHKIWGPPILKSLLNITQYKKLAINTLRFTYWNFKSCKSHENNETKNVRP